MTAFERKCTASGLSRSELARKLGVTPRAASKWFSGESKPEAQRVPTLADLLGITPEEVVDLFHQTDVNQSTPAPAVA